MGKWITFLHSEYKKEEDLVSFSFAFFVLLIAATIIVIAFIKNMPKDPALLIAFTFLLLVTMGIIAFSYYGHAKKYLSRFKEINNLAGHLFELLSFFSAVFFSLGVVTSKADDYTKLIYILGMFTLLGALFFLSSIYVKRYKIQLFVLALSALAISVAYFALVSLSRLFGVML